MLENEPTILAPKPRHKLFKKGYAKPLAGLAVAASVTAVAIFGLQTSNQQIPGLESMDGELPQVAIIDTEQTVVPVLQAATEPALVNESIVANSTSVRTVKYEPANTLQPQQLNRYIMNHNQHNSRMGVQGVSPYARLVGHDAK
jgi:negative regulator of sigma E activity